MKREEKKIQILTKEFSFNIQVFTKTTFSLIFFLVYDKLFSIRLWQ